jgi:hypothetical protein
LFNAFRAKDAVAVTRLDCQSLPRTAALNVRPSTSNSNANPCIGHHLSGDDRQTAAAPNRPGRPGHPMFGTCLVRRKTAKSRYEMEKSPEDAFRDRGRGIGLETRIQVLLEEYRALYGLLTFRLTAMDRRLPVAGGTLGAVLGATTAMPDATKTAFLLGLPAALLWLFLTTVQHARSKEDHLRRIDEIERFINRLAGEELLLFQSRHPNRRKSPGGRTGRAEILALLSTCGVMLAASGFLVTHPVELLPPILLPAYYGYTSVCGCLMMLGTLQLRRYRYRRPPPGVPPVFEIHENLP